MWTHFYDKHSGGEQKEKWGHIYIESPQKLAELIFYNRFGHNPNRITCTCGSCGEDYSISQQESLEQLTGYVRGCVFDNNAGKYIEQDREQPWRPYQTFEEYTQGENVLVICRDEIKEEEMIGLDEGL